MAQGWRGCSGALLTPAEQEELGLSDEASLCRDEQLTFRAIPISDRDVPRPHDADVQRLLAEIVSALCTGRHVAIHCRMGIGRSAMIAAAALVALGETPERAFTSITSARGLPLPD